MQFGYVRPETGGVSPRTIHRFLDACEKEVNSLYSFVIAKGADILSKGFYAPMEEDQLKIMHSVSKSLNSLAIGIAIGEGKLHLDDYLIDFFQDELPDKRDPRIDRIQIKHMLMMASNSAYTSASFVKVPTSWRTAYLAMTPFDEPGRYFSYDTGASYMLSCILTKVMGKTIDILRERVFGPMGIEKSHWLEDRDGNNTGGWGCYLLPMDMVKIGRLLMNYGAWEGRQLVPAWYMRHATAKQIDTYRNPGMGWPYGYGYQFWRYPENTFGCFGAFGQLIICNAEKDLWITTTGGCTEKECQRMVRIATETIMAESLDQPLPMDDVAYNELRDRIDRLTLPTAVGDAVSADESAFLGKTFRFPDNPAKIEEINFRRDTADTLDIVLRYDGKPVKCKAKHNAWLTTTAPLDTPMHTIHSFSYGWTGGNRLQLKQYMCNSSYYKLYNFTFEADQLAFTVGQNVTLYDSDDDKPIVGRAQ